MFKSKKEKIEITLQKIQDCYNHLILFGSQNIRDVYLNFHFGKLMRDEITPNYKSTIKALKSLRDKHNIIKIDKIKLKGLPIDRDNYLKEEEKFLKTKVEINLTMKIKLSTIKKLFKDNKDFICSPNFFINTEWLIDFDEKEKKEKE